MTHEPKPIFALAGIKEADLLKAETWKLGDATLARVFAVPVADTRLVGGGK